MRATVDSTAKTIIEFVKKEIIHSFGPPKVIVSDNAGCFTAVNLKKFMAECGIAWKTVAA